MAKHTSEWIREAMATGLKMPKEIQAYIKKKHGKVVSRPYICTRTKTFNGQMATASPPEPTPQPKEPAASNKVAVAKPQQKPSNGDLVGALKAVQGAAAKVGGIRRLGELVEVLGKMK